MFTDPAKTIHVYKSFASLRIYTLLNFASRVGSNLILCHSFHCVVALLRNPTRHQARVYPRKHPVAIVFVLFALATTVFVEESIRRAYQACAAHPECVVHAHRWTTRSISDGSGLNQCPCKVVIDNDKAPISYELRRHTKNATASLAKLSASGDLEAVQLINRLLPVFPTKLRRCKNLRHVSLMHTQTQVLPPWFKEFTALEYQRIERSPGLPGLQSIPSDAFDDLSRLTFLHLGVHEKISKLPSFQGLVNLRTLTLVILGSLREVPALNDKAKLVVLVIIVVPLLEALPDLTSVSSTLRQFTYEDRNAACYNGFIDNQCDLENARCGYKDVWAYSAATCLPSNRSDRIATPGTVWLLEKFSSIICGNPYQLPEKRWRGTHAVVTAANVGACNGAKYHQRVLSGGSETGICYNMYYLPISCSARPQLIQMRQRQIEHGVGEACDPDLGCDST